MHLSRRDMFKLGGLAAVGAAGLAIPFGNTVSGASASLLPSAKMPKPYQTPFYRLPVLAPGPGKDRDPRAGPAFSGLASQYHLHDAQERALLPQGEFDVALTLSDMMLAANGSLMYDDRTHSGLWGDIIQVTALAGDEGEETHLPVPGAQRLHFPVPTGPACRWPHPCTWWPPTAA